MARTKEDLRKYNTEYARVTYLKNRSKRLAASKRWADKNKEYRKAYNKAWKAKQGPNYLRNKSLLRYYGMTLEQLQVMIDSQAGLCSICTLPFASTVDTHVDHDHKTGKTRSILCARCNLGLGHFKDDCKLLLAAVDYLERHRS